MKRLALSLFSALALAVPSSAAAFHHVPLPATSCAAPAAGSPTNDNGQAKEAISAHNPAQTPPLPPIGGAAQDNLVAAPAHEGCANA